MDRATAEKLTVNALRAVGAKGFTDKAKVGDYIQSFDVTNPPDPRRGSYLGKVVKLDTDEFDGVEYVNYVADFYIQDGMVERFIKGRKLRAPQNGTPTSMGNITDGISVIRK